MLTAYLKSFGVNTSKRLTKQDAMGAACKVAIRHGFRFDDDDFALLIAELKKRMGAFYGIGENHYALAAGRERGVLNVSFCRAYEKHCDFKPFLLKDETPSGRRLFDGMERLEWAGEVWRVASWGFEDGTRAYLNLIQNKHESSWSYLRVGSTLSFYDDQKHYLRHRILAVSDDKTTITINPQPEDKEEGVNSVTRRIRLTYAQIQEFNAQAKEAWAMLAPLGYDERNTYYGPKSTPYFPTYASAANFLMCRGMDAVRAFVAQPESERASARAERAAKIKADHEAFMADLNARHPLPGRNTTP